MTAWPTGLTRPLVSTLNSADGRVKANAVVLPAGDNSAISIYATDTTDVIVDIDGYFIAPGSSTLAFFSLPPCRVADTRGADGPLGGPMLLNGQVRDFPVRRRMTDWHFFGMLDRKGTRIVWVDDAIVNELV